MAAISMTTEGSAAVRLSKPILLLLLLLSVSPILSAQARETDRVQVQASAPQAPKSSEAPATGVASATDSLSTGITGAPVALGPGDLLEINVFDTPELTQKIRVDSDGKIALALIGEIVVKGISPGGLEKLIRSKLIDGNFVKDPQVSVFVAEYAGQSAYITGEVNRPGAYPLLRSHRLGDLISVAGGFTARAGNAVIITHEGASAQPIHIDLSDKDEEQSNPEILPGDNITIGQTGIVYVLGDVERPGGFLLDRRTTLSVMQALALAEGIKSSASITKASLIRTNGEARQEIPLNLKAILKSQSPDLPLQAGDIIFVPGSLTRGMGRRTIDVILQSAGFAAIYAARP
jgi:polysaccharide export outer membrane protein